MMTIVPFQSTSCSEAQIGPGFVQLDARMPRLESPGGGIFQECLCSVFRLLLVLGCLVANGCATPGDDDSNSNASAGDGMYQPVAVSLKPEDSVESQQLPLIACRSELCVQEETTPRDVARSALVD